MRGRGAYLIGLMILLLPAAGAAESWTGRIRCVTLPDLNTLPLNGAFTLEVDGTRAAFSRGVHNPDSASLSGIVETGNGSVSGADVKLVGSAAARSYSFTSTYQGRIDGNRMTLTGEQVWLSPRYAQPFHRACSISLTR